MSGFSNWQHMLSLPTVSLAGNTAKARTDFFATHRGKKENDFDVHYNASGAFHDELVRTPDGWRIQFRRLEVYFGDPLQIARWDRVYALGLQLLVGELSSPFLRSIAAETRVSQDESHSAVSMSALAFHEKADPCQGHVVGQVILFFPSPG
jgi:hypothetical protein